MKLFMLLSLMVTLNSGTAFAQDPFKDCNASLHERFGSKISFSPNGKVMKAGGIYGETPIFKPGTRIVDHSIFEVADRGGDIADYETVFFGSDGKPSGVQYAVKLPGYMSKFYDHFNGKSLKFAYDADGTCRVDEVKTFTYDNDIQKFDTHKVVDANECKLVEDLYQTHPYLAECDRISITDVALFKNIMDTLDGTDKKLKLTLKSVKVDPKPKTESDPSPDESVNALAALSLRCIDPVLSTQAEKELKLSKTNLVADAWHYSEKLPGDLEYLPLKKVNAIKKRCDYYSELKPKHPAQSFVPNEAVEPIERANLQQVISGQ